MIDCLRLPVADLPAALAFYRDRLGLELLWRTADAAGLQMAEDASELVLFTGEGNPEIDLLVDSADQAAEQFAAAGGSLLVPPFDIRIGLCTIVQDPWGNPLVLLDMSKGRLTVDTDKNVTGTAKP
jgi:catechol 2,3-dioxygenase-like lactoylglutathione lyase family enzyme